MLVVAAEDTTAEGSGCEISCPFRLRSAERTAPLPTVARIRNIGLRSSYHCVLPLQLVLQRVGIGMCEFSDEDEWTGSSVRASISGCCN